MSGQELIDVRGIQLHHMRRAFLCYNGVKLGQRGRGGGRGEEGEGRRAGGGGRGEEGEGRRARGGGQGEEGE